MKPIILALAGLIVGCVPACAQQGSAPAGNAENGKTLYLQVGCYQCHGQAGQGARMTGPRISRTEFPFEGFLYQLRHPANQMPPYEAAVAPTRMRRISTPMCGRCRRRAIRTASRCSRRSIESSSRAFSDSLESVPLFP